MSYVVTKAYDSKHAATSSPKHQSKSYSFSMAHHPPPTDPPQIPSDEEAKYYLYGLYSDARLIARSNSDIRMQQTGPEAYLEKKEFRPFGPHLLDDLWEDSIVSMILS
ncbi:hypothetical protein MMC07_003057 [Pseudocyphellaria aurata]|nr:hypothetical protein [Pseudocyphellaria aurata]